MATTAYIEGLHLMQTRLAPLATSPTCTADEETEDDSVCSDWSGEGTYPFLTQPIQGLLKRFPCETTQELMDRHDHGHFLVTCLREYLATLSAAEDPVLGIAYPAPLPPPCSDHILHTGCVIDRPSVPVNDQDVTQVTIPHKSNTLPNLTLPTSGTSQRSSTQQQTHKQSTDTPPWIPSYMINPNDTLPSKLRETCGSKSTGKPIRPPKPRPWPAAGIPNWFAI
jgi:hypothetical protein